MKEYASVVPQRKGQDYPEFDVDVDDQTKFTADFPDINCLCFHADQLQFASRQWRDSGDLQKIENWITCSPDTKIKRRVTEEFRRRVSAVLRFRNEDEDELLQSRVNILRNQELLPNVSDLHYSVTRPSLSVVLSN